MLFCSIPLISPIWRFEICHRVDIMSLPQNASPSNEGFQTCRSTAGIITCCYVELHLATGCLLHHPRMAYTMQPLRHGPHHDKLLHGVVSDSPLSKKKKP